MSQSTAPKRSTPPIPVTLNCSGGISLGAYMAGIFYELIKEAVKPDSKIIVDIITGASAGAMTGAIAAYYLLRENRERMLNEPVEANIFYKAWVEKIDMEGIDRLGFAPEDGQWSLLSGKKIAEIAELLRQKPLAIEKTQPLALLMTLTNLQGLLKETGFKTEDGEAIRVLSSAETRLFLFDSGLDTKKVNSMWEKVIIGGTASGAFPVAFPPVADDSLIDSPNLENLVDDYRDLDNKDLLKDIVRSDPKKKEFIFSYTDGGVLDGLPICKGIQIENDLLSNKHYPSDANPFKKYWAELRLNPDGLKLDLDNDVTQNENRRRYVYIQPKPVDKLETLQKEEPSLFQKHFPMLTVAIKALTLTKTEHDAIRLQEIRERNEDYKREFENRINLRDLLRSQFGSQSREIENKLEEPLPYRFIQLNRISPSTIRKIKGITKLKAIDTALSKNSYIQAKLDKGDTAGLLASDFFGAFGGFFDKRYREHDFLLGRLSGLVWLHQRCSDLQISDTEIQNLVEQIEGVHGQKFLTKDPTLADLQTSQHIRIVRIFLRFIRIVLIEATLGGKFWLLKIFSFLLIILIGTTELLLTGVMKVFQAFRN
ncbi:patatin-like phospholipase family protein [Nostoc sp. 'Peltigera membranacea cyanobiont' N6]|uniref:patatin-like phospholipase family protein n=1 Tax=Nostoc sp. 'Peltigera membranacea cyanobiont' N6 TaxID=1261031 RepID=UPI000CF34476|nr:patatin-like phospholipase family protein [Nostoc sp. 'Peltigera membranacea cyanobiont' N6]AVH68575.1 patatin-like phospholipase [Nostoc sp. 'Peltigera membranacea cyanobiont' N6]